jgi:hypothetical protein
VGEVAEGKAAAVGRAATKGRVAVEGRTAEAGWTEGQTRETSPNALNYGLTLSRHSVVGCCLVIVNYICLSIILWLCIKNCTNKG